MSTTHREFFGDAERDFRLTPKLIAKLERVTSAGIGSLCKKMFAGDFSHTDILQTIRLALIGGGASPEEAANLVAVYGEDAPLARLYPLAVATLEACWFGVDVETEEAAQ
jgi:hypothetical protein